MTALLRRMRRRLRDERGFTLVELLVAMSLALVVSTATLALVIVSGHLSSNYQDRIDANQQGRVAMERITQALNSSCVASSITPVLAGSSPTQIWFYTSNTDAPEITPSEDTLSIVSNSLLLTTYPVSGSAGTWTLNSSGGGTNFTLLPYAGLATVNGTASTPLFQYYSYNPIGQTALIPLDDRTVADRRPGGHRGHGRRSASGPFRPITGVPPTGRRDLSDSVILRLSPASTSAGASNSPCT